MLLQIFTVFDIKAEAYLEPFYTATKGQAIRSFSDTCQEKGHPFNLHPEDYTMFHLGAYDNSNATFEILPTAAPIGKAIEFIQPE